jgi:HlyD family secretion protein
VRRALLLIALAAAARGLACSRGATDGAVVVTGFVEGEERIIRSEVSGRVLEVLVREGDEVKRGDILARLDARQAVSRRLQQELSLRTLAAEAEKAQAVLELTRVEVAGAVRLANAALEQARADAALARKTVERERALREQRITSEQALDDVETRLAVAEAAAAERAAALENARGREREVPVAAASLAALEARAALETERLRELDLDLERYELRADAAGTVEARHIRAGELAQPGTPVCSILDEGQKFVRIFLPVAALARVRVGARAIVELDAAPEAPIEGEVDWIESQASFTPRKIYTQDDRTQQVYAARVRLAAGAARAIKAGAEANVRVVPGAAAAVAAAGRPGA